MGIEDAQIREIVRRVVGGMDLQSPGSAPAVAKESATGLRGVFTTAEAALAAAERAFAQYRRASLAKRKAIVEELRKTCVASAQRLARMAVDESGMGRVSDKVMKHHLVAEKTPGVEDLPSRAFVGDHGLTTEEPAPFGIIFAVTPTTNPSATLFNNAISMLAAGNVIYFAPHPRALKTALTCIDLINEAIERAGGPANLVVTTDTVDLATVQAMMRHPKIALLCVTGGTGVVDQALTSGKRVIGAAAGNPPALVDDSADPGKAARDIIAGHSFDNNLPCVAEKEVIVTAAIADDLMTCFRSAPDVVTLAASGLDLLEKVVLNADRSGPNPKMIGKNACVILRELGITAGEEVRAIVVEADRFNPIVRHELMMPVLGVVRVGGFEEAVDVAVEVEGGLRHSAIIHSSNIYHMSEFAHAIGTTIFVKNAPSFAGIGFGGEGPTSFTIAGRTGEGLASAHTFTRVRRCALVGAFSLT
ncbi:aldehyde dehydrogenase family protein [Siculibacillus lacustris]|uniref:Aldehyde dehydrogenase family protein n=1 Tax=Siculibacillus lacustris TaxID=1549641 RepID=A0A4Q9VPL7_9HYPH|nr:aldehyde dehydrogenase [Siculibacillus lacustris]TBW36777.1 aldehyde dehydrogenase family protein [Siculibacillus lacustris]